MVFECGLNWITGCYITITPKNIKPAHNIASPFYYEMVRYQEEYLQYLLFQKLNMRAITHADIINAFINYLFKYHLVSDINQITVAMVKSKFYSHYKQEYDTSIDKKIMQEIIKGFFTFIYGKYGIKNETLMRGLAK